MTTTATEPKTATPPDASATVSGLYMANVVQAFTNEGLEYLDQLIEIDLSPKGVLVRHERPVRFGRPRLLVTAGPVHAGVQPTGADRLTIQGRNLATWLKTWSNAAHPGDIHLLIKKADETRTRSQLVATDEVTGAMITITETLQDWYKGSNADASGSKPGNASTADHGAITFDTTLLERTIDIAVGATQPIHCGFDQSKPTVRTDEEPRDLRIRVTERERPNGAPTAEITAAGRNTYAVVECGAERQDRSAADKPLYIPLEAAKLFSRLVKRHMPGESLSTVTTTSIETAYRPTKREGPANPTIRVEWVGDNEQRAFPGVEELLEKLRNAPAYEMTVRPEMLHRLAECSAELGANDGLDARGDTVELDMKAGTGRSVAGDASVRVGTPTTEPNADNGIWRPHFNTRRLLNVLSAHYDDRIRQNAEKRVTARFAPRLGVITLSSATGRIVTGLKSTR